MAVIQKYYSVIHCIIDNTTYFSHHNIITVSSHTEVITALLAFIAYRFMDQKVKWWLNTCTWRYSTSWKYCYCKVSASFILVDVSVSVYDALIMRASFKFLKLISNMFYCPNTGTTDDREWSLMITYVKNIGIIDNVACNIFVHHCSTLSVLRITN
jgi:hypothetical protein